MTETAYRKYPKYKSSGIDWFGNIPAEWNLVPTRSLFRTKKQVVGANAEKHLLLGLTLNGVNPRDLSLGGKNPSDYMSYQIFESGELVICLFDYDVTPRTIGYVKQKGMMTGAYTRLVPRTKLDPRYYYYLFLYLDKKKELLHLCTGLRNSIPKHIFWSLQNLQPSLGTQKQIADFLDEKTEIIDELVGKKERLIKLLREKRFALITRAVTKGIDPNAKLKPSGVEWLGDIPAGGKVRKLRTLGTFSASGIDKKTVAGEETVRMVNYTDIYGNTKFAISQDMKLMETTAPKSKAKEHSLCTGDILFTPSSETEEDIGVSAVVLDDMPNVVYSYHLIRLRPKPGVLDIQYSKYFANNTWTLKQFSALCKGTTRQILTRDIFKITQVVVPPLKTQKRIADFLDTETAKIDKAVAFIESQIEKFKEYRSSLIYSAVTGKIKV